MLVLVLVLVPVLVPNVYCVSYSEVSEYGGGAEGSQNHRQGLLLVTVLLLVAILLLVAVTVTVLVLVLVLLTVLVLVPKVYCVSYSEVS